MKFLNVSGAREEFREAVGAYEQANDSPGEDYWRLRDYCYVSEHPSDNFGLRKILAYEKVDQEVIAELLTEVLDSGKDLADVNHEVVEAALGICTALQSIADADMSATDQAEKMAAVGDVSDLPSWRPILSAGR